MNNTKLLILKTPLYKHLFITFIGIGFTCIGVALTFTEDYFFGYGMAIFSLAGTFLLARRDRTALTLDETSITYRSKKIPWSEVKNIHTATQLVKYDKQKYLAISLHKENDDAMNIVSRAMTLSGMDDKSIASFYIPLTELPGNSIENIVDEINNFRNSL